MTDYRRDPRWMVGRRVTRLLEAKWGESWSRQQQAMAHHLMRLWESGQLHERQLEDYLEGRIRR